MTRIKSFVQYEVPRLAKAQAESAKVEEKQTPQAAPPVTKSQDAFEAGPVQTRAIPEGGSFPPPGHTTQAIGENGDHNVNFTGGPGLPPRGHTTQAIGENGDHDVNFTPGAPVFPVPPKVHTTQAIGENGDHNLTGGPLLPPKGHTTQAIGEDGSGLD